MNSFDRSALLRAVVSCQQMISLVVEAARLDPSTQRKVMDTLTEEFENLRRYITLLDMPPAELLVSVHHHHVLWIAVS